MESFQLTTPVVFMVFNNPYTTQRVFEEIRRAQPTVLLVIADGPRPDRMDDIDKCAAVRAIVDQVDWPCKVMKNYSEVNLGCGKRVSSGLDWGFRQVEEAIILEHDCIPHPSFFRFCQELLERYRNDSRIMSISGTNFQFGHRRTEYSYYFSRYLHVWGWATWRRVWTQYYDYNLALWPEIREKQYLFDIFASLQADHDWKHAFRLTSGSNVCAYWDSIFERVYSGMIDTWDYQLLFASLIQNGLNILPAVNLVSNAGFGSEASHTTATNEFANIAACLMEFPLKHPRCVIRDACADEYTQANHFI